MTKYRVWHDHECLWDEDELAKGDLECEASSMEDAAEKLAVDLEDFKQGKFIVHDVSADSWHRVELVRAFTSTDWGRTTIEELCSPWPIPGASGTSTADGARVPAAAIT